MEEKNDNLPKTLQQAIIFFADPDVALTFMAELRWPDGPTCPACESKEYSFISTRRVWKCKACKKQYTVKQGTLMEDSALGLDKWLCAIWMIANDKNGISSYEIHRGLGITQKSAWFLLHRIRLAMQTGTFQKLSGTIEADETYVGGLARNMHKDKRAKKIKGTGSAGKAIVMGILERHGEVRAKVIPDATKETLHREVRANVQHGSELHTDSWASYAGLETDYVHKVINHAEAYVKDNVTTNGIENFWSLLKRGLKGTYVNVMPFHLFRYVDEQSFRFNYRKLNDQQRFLIACASMDGRRLTYKKLIGETLMRDETTDGFRDTLFPL